ncbi:MAG: hypothetical protein KDA24_26300 [Deltaproteobacteria bacterium]|nr:hypothetical protein [Deltaproteobacteria bacterium]
MSSTSTIARGADDPASQDAAQRLLDQGREKLAEDDSAAAHDAFSAAVDALRGSSRLELLVGALAALATIDEDAGRARQALDWWLQALIPADVLARAKGSENPDLGIFVRVRVATLLREGGDLAGSEAMGWDCVSQSVALGRLETAPAGLLTVLRIAAAEGANGVRERVVELDELLAGFDGYRLHSLPRPLPLPYMVHDTARQYAEAGLFGEATPAFATAVRTYAALDAPDLAARAAVDLARSAMEDGALDLADDSLARAAALDPAASREAGKDAVAAEVLLRRGGVRAAGLAFETLARETVDPARKALYLGRAARLLGIDDPGRALDLHPQAIALLERGGARGEALVEETLLAFQYGRAGQWRQVSEALGRIDKVLGEEGGPTLPSEVRARLAVTRAGWHLSREEFSLARDALAGAGSALFRRADTDGVAAVAVHYVDVALAEGSPEAVDAALANARQVEESLGLRVDGWRAMAAAGRVARSRGEGDQAFAAFAEAATRVEWLAWTRDVPREAATLGEPGSRLYGPWVDALLEAGRQNEAFEVLQRWRAWSQGAEAGRKSSPERAAIVALRESLAAISTRATEEDPTLLREPLLQRLASLAPSVQPRGDCNADAVRAGLTPRTGLIDGAVTATASWLFLVDSDGLEVRRVPDAGLPKRDPLHRRVKRLRGIATTTAVAWTPTGRPLRQVGAACDLALSWAPPSAAVVGLAGLLHDTGDVVSRVLGGGHTASEGLEGAVVVAARPLALAQVRALAARGASAVVVSERVDPAALAAALGKGQSLDKALASVVPPRSDAPQVWGPLNGLSGS